MKSSHRGGPTGHKNCIFNLNRLNFCWQLLFLYHWQTNYLYKYVHHPVVHIHLHMYNNNFLQCLYSCDHSYHYYHCTPVYLLKFLKCKIANNIFKLKFSNILWCTHSGSEMMCIWLVTVGILAISIENYCFYIIGKNYLCKYVHHSQADIHLHMYSNNFLQCLYSCEYSYHYYHCTPVYLLK